MYIYLRIFCDNSLVMWKLQHPNVLGNMGWQRMVGSLSSQGAFAKKPCTTSAFFAKNPYFEMTY